MNLLGSKAARGARRGIGRRAETKPSWQQGSSGGFQQIGREKQTDLFDILTGGGGFTAGGG